MLPYNGTSQYITAEEEIQALPRQWKAKCGGRNNRVAFYHREGGTTYPVGTYVHPIYGMLPQPWELRQMPDGGAYFYYNTEMNQVFASGPRKIRRPPSRPPNSIVAQPSDGGEFVRREVSRHPLYSKYSRIHTLDPGNGDLGGMNRGVYVVQDITTNKVYVEKVFGGSSSVGRRLAKAEIGMMRRLIHNSIIHYIEAYVQDDPFQASLYMEFCDRGSLGDLLQVYMTKKRAHSPDRIPESFIWHAFVGLADALGYLQTGQSYASKPLQRNNPYDWVPIVHCDIKPNNILLLSRDTPGSTQPFHTLLADFGLMGYEQDFQGIQETYGTIEYHAPELGFDPYPQEHQKHLMVGSHSCKSDVWALACIIFCMCERDDLAHMNRDCWPLRSRRAMGRAAKKTVLNIADTDIYSHYLSRTIAWAASSDPSQRPDGWGLVAHVKAQRERWLKDPRWKEEVQVNGRLPPEATKEIVFHQNYWDI